MVDPLIISTLTKKRAEIDGAVRAMEIKIAQLKQDRLVVDAAIRVFDPTKIPAKIRPIFRRAKPRLFRHGQCSRAVMEVLRVAEKPLTLKAIAEKVVAEYHIELKEPDDFDSVMHKVRANLNGKGLTREVIGKDVTWRIAE